MCMGQAVRIEDIQAGRKKPGLLRQHLTALHSAQQVCNAKVTGAKLKAMTVTFVPHAIKAGSYECDIGSAVSTTLVLQTLLPALLQVWQVHSSDKSFPSPLKPDIPMKGSKQLYHSGFYQ